MQSTRIDYPIVVGIFKLKDLELSRRAEIEVRLLIPLSGVDSVSERFASPSQVVKWLRMFNRLITEKDLA